MTVTLHAIARYEIKAELGRGGMATVYHAYDPRFKREVAIKVLPREFLHEPTFRTRFEREAQTLAALDHPAIVTVYDFGEHEGQPYLVMRYMPGGSLADRIAQGPLPLGEAAHIIAYIAPALDEAHAAGIIHRDFKPANILFDKRGDPHLSDFGIVKLTETTAQLTGSGIIGTPAYMAPEMSQENGLSPLVDIYALGVTLFQMVTGKLPYRADTPMGLLMAHVARPIPDARVVRPDLPDAVQVVIERAMAKEPTERYPSAGEMAAELSAAVLMASTDAKDLSPLQDGLMPPVPPGEPTMDVPRTPPALPQQELPTADQPPTAETYPLPQQAQEEAQTAPIAASAAQPAKRRMISAWGWIGGLAAVTALVLLADNIWHLGIISRSGAIESRSAYYAVGHNADWPPVTQEFDGVEMALAPVGCFMMGSDSGDGSEQPAHQQCFTRPFWIDRTEVTNAQFRAFDGQAAQDSYWTDDNRPRVNITWFEAADFCKLRGARLPTEAEWEYAARGPDGLAYPWGNEFNGDNAVWNMDQTAEAGSRPDGVSWVGALDMSGNVWEWVGSWYGPYPYNAGDGREGEDGSYSYRVLRGGSWYDADTLTLGAVNRNWYFPSNSLGSLGFRCARNY